MHLFSSKSAFQTERVARLSLVKRAVSAADWEIGDIWFVLMFGCKWLVISRSIPPVFLSKNHLPFPKGGKSADFLICLSVAEIWCKQVVYVQTCGLHKRSMNAPTDLFYKYICLWPGFDINRLLDNPFVTPMAWHFPLHRDNKVLLIFGVIALLPKLEVKSINL